MADSGPDSTLYLYTSLTAGSSHIITATSRLETILKANKLPFRAVDVATDEAARKLWGRRSRGKKLPGLVKYGSIVGDLEEIEEWNEYGELRMQIASVPAVDSTPMTSNPNPNHPSAPASSVTTPPAKTASPRIQIQDPPSRDSPKLQDENSTTLAFRQAGEEAAAKAKENTEARKSAKATTLKPEAADPTHSESAVEEEEDVTKLPKENPKSDSRRTSAAKKSLQDVRRRASMQRPSIVDMPAVESSSEVTAKDTPGGMEHHRSVSVSATSPQEIKKVADELDKAEEEQKQEEKGETQPKSPTSQHLEPAKEEKEHRRISGSPAVPGDIKQLAEVLDMVDEETKEKRRISASLPHGHKKPSIHEAEKPRGPLTHPHPKPEDEPPATEGSAATT